MSTEDPTAITSLLHAHSTGDREAFDQLIPLIYDRLTKIARARVRRSAVDPAALDTVGLVHETWAHLVHEEGVDWTNRHHFFAVCSRAMRRVVVDHARHRSARKRGGGVAVPTTLDSRSVGIEEQADLALAIDQALERLAALDPRLVQVIEHRFFAGLTEEETAEAMGVSARTVQRLWARARTWLQRTLGPVET